ncbi:MAG: hypothetical protein C4533_08185 [Candidatus Omnitrophota bacterium]|jgi:type II secretory pathway pseudopilin PulG|nr:MAG: hypothetical protein C4533_08185 [Candidatus Omnitrophota bacterium]
MGNSALKNIKNKNGQTVLETAIVMIAMIILLGGILQFWFWSNNQIIRRQREYNETRVQAGTSPLLSFMYQMQWPLEREEEITDTNKYTPYVSGVGE